MLELCSNILNPFLFFLGLVTWLLILTGDEDGIMMGDERPLSHSFRVTLTDFFKAELSARRIKLHKPAVIFSPAQLTFSDIDHYSNAVALEIQKHMGNSFAVANPDEVFTIYYN